MLTFWSWNIHYLKIQTHISNKKGRISGLSLPLTGQRVGLVLPLAKQSAEKRAQRVLEALAISTGTAKTKASCKLAFGWGLPWANCKRGHKWQRPRWWLIIMFELPNRLVLIIFGFNLQGYALILQCHGTQWVKKHRFDLQIFNHIFLF